MNPLDELNNLITEWVEKIQTQTLTKSVDELLELLIIAYAFGVEDVNKSTDSDKKVSKDKMNQSIYKQIDGKTWEDRIKEYTDIEQFKILAENEMSRVFSEGQWDCANEIKNLNKTWNTMNDDKVREEHWYLDGDTIPLEEPFRTLSGDEAYYPRGFNVPELDCGCRCFLTYSKRGDL